MPLHLRTVGTPHWCRLLSLGAMGAVTVCRDRIAPSAHLQLCSDPPAVDRCPACERELVAQPRNAVLFEVEDLDDAASSSEWADTWVVGRAETVAAPCQRATTTREIRKPEVR